MEERDVTLPHAKLGVIDQPKACPGCDRGEKAGREGRRNRMVARLRRGHTERLLLVSCVSFCLHWALELEAMKREFLFTL